MAESQNTFCFSSHELFQLSVTGRVDASAVSNPELLFGEITRHNEITQKLISHTRLRVVVRM